MQSITRKVLSLFIFTVALTACASSATKTRIEYRVPRDFEGAVVIFLNQPDGIAIAPENDTMIVPVPPSGVVKIKNSASDLDGLPLFKAFEPNGNVSTITYVRLENQPAFESSRLYGSLSEEERNSLVFSINYEKGSLSTKSGVVRFRSFLICKPKDGNLFASRDLNRKMNDFIRAQ